MWPLSSRGGGGGGKALVVGPLKKNFIFVCSSLTHSNSQLLSHFLNLFFLIHCIVNILASPSISIVLFFLNFSTSFFFHLSLFVLSRWALINCINNIFSFWSDFFVVNVGRNNKKDERNRNINNCVDISFPINLLAFWLLCWFSERFLAHSITILQKRKDNRKLEN